MLVPVERVRLELEGRELEVGTAVGTWRVPLAGATVRRGPVRKPGWKLFALRLPGLHVGLFRKDGVTTAMVVLDDDRAVTVVPTSGRTWVVSPEDPAAFVAALVERGAIEG